MMIHFTCLRNRIICMMVLCIVLAGFVRPAHSQDIKSEAIYRRGVALFTQNKYVAARLDFNEIITGHPSSQRVTSALVLLSKSYFRLDEYENARNTALIIRSSHPQSRYTEWALYMIAACDFKMANTREAIAGLANIISGDRDKSLTSHAVEALRHTILPESDTDLFYETLAENGIDRATFDSYNVIVDAPVSEELPGESVTATFTEGTAIRIGLLAPLSGSNSVEGGELLKGVQAVVNSHSAINGTPVELIVEDTRSNPIESVMATHRLIDKGVIALIGPVYGESTIPAAVAANAAGIPFLAPTSTDIGLARIGASVFQMNLTPAVQGFSLADLAVKILGYDNAALICTADWWGDSLAATFKDHFERNGGYIIASESFEPGVKKFNFDEILMRIRANSPESEAQPDSMVVFGADTAFPDTVFIKPDPELLTLRMKPVNSIDCIVISAFTDEAIEIARQISVYKISTVLLGDTGWSGNALDSASEDYLNSIEGAYLVATDIGLSGDLGSKYFTDDFASRRLELVDLVARKGYDSCAVIMDCLERGARNPSALIAALENVENFIGLTSVYTIDPATHVNVGVRFVQIRNGRYVPVSSLGLPVRNE